MNSRFAAFAEPPGPNRGFKGHRKSIVLVRFGSEVRLTGPAAKAENF
jgi:hypothetical protein